MIIKKDSKLNCLGSFLFSANSTYYCCFSPYYPFSTQNATLLYR